ncbi:hypothetical protein [Rhizobium binxianense]
MSRLTDSSLKADPLQRSFAAHAIVADPSSNPMLSGLAAIAPRLALVLAFAGFVQMTLNLIAH